MASLQGCKRYLGFPIISMANGDVLYTEFGFDHAGAALVAFVQTKPFKVGSS